MEVVRTPISSVLLIKPKVFADHRGFFLEAYSRKRYAELAGIDATFVQNSHSHSTYGVLRGLHYQLNYPQGKLVMVTQGEVFDVAVDIRKGSPTFGQWYGAVLSAENHYQLWVPPNFAHGFCVLSESADFFYMCTDVYHPEDEKGLIWNDSTVNIRWPLTNPILSKKDRSFLSLEELSKSNDLPNDKGVLGQ